MLPYRASAVLVPGLMLVLVMPTLRAPETAALTPRSFVVPASAGAHRLKPELRTSADQAILARPESDGERVAFLRAGVSSRDRADSLDLGERRSRAGNEKDGTLAKIEVTYLKDKDEG